VQEQTCLVLLLQMEKLRSASVKTLGITSLAYFYKFQGSQRINFRIRFQRNYSLKITVEQAKTEGKILWCIGLVLNRKGTLFENLLISAAQQRNWLWKPGETESEHL
jgi:hypothetical protein